MQQINRIVLALVLVMIINACVSQKAAKGINARSGDTRTGEVEFINNQTYKLIVYADDKTYGYDKNNPIKVGGVKEDSGPLNERRYLNALLGPNGEQVHYYRAGSCCAFKTPNGFIDNTGLLDQYKVYWEGSQDTLSLYLNMYDKGDLKVPVGFKAKK